MEGTMLKFETKGEEKTPTQKIVERTFCTLFAILVLWYAHDMLQAMLTAEWIESNKFKLVLIWAGVMVCAYAFFKSIHYAWMKK